jgi:predicted ATP-dependent endonuclease of OLD family
MSCPKGGVQLIIKSLHIENFRCIRDATLDCDNLTALIGPNGSGKSSFLKALDDFYSPNADFSEEDFYNRDTSQPIVIRVTFAELTKKEEELLSPHIGVGKLTVEKIIEWSDGRVTQKYHGYRKQNPEFREIRGIERVTDRRTKYKELRQKNPDLQELPGNSSGERIEEELAKWEALHPDKLEWIIDEGRFFGFKEVGTSKLERFTRFIFVPAVREASLDATEAKGSAITEIMDLVVRSVLAGQGELDKLEKETQEHYRTVMQSNIDTLRKLQDSMNGILNKYVATAKLHLSWFEDFDVSIPTPRAKLKLEEDGFPVDVERVGHGLQRAFILTALQQLAFAESISPENVRNEEKGTQENLPPSIILGIEEPELYQHPSRQRHLAKILLELSKSGIAGVASKVQVLYTSHSPLFIDLERFDQIRLIRKKMVETGKPRQSEVTSTTLADVTQTIAATCGASYSIDRETARFQTLINPYTCEGFFADFAVLVEGEHDRSAILAVAQMLGLSLESMGISVIPCIGKLNLIKAAAIFQSFGIPIYLVWDNDKMAKKPNPKENRKLLRFLNEPEEDFPFKVTEKYACFEHNVEHTIKQEITDELYEELLHDCRKKYDFSKKSHAMKNPIVMHDILSRAKARGKECKTLSAIVQEIARRGNV